MNEMTVKPFDNCPALGGYHCQTNALAKMFHFYGHPLSEDMLLGLGAGMGFFYWHQKGLYPMVLGRGNTKNFFSDIAERLNIRITDNTTSSESKAENALLNHLEKNEPVMVFGDMAYMPWFDFPDDYHFGGHTFVICGYDGQDQVLITDMDPSVAGLKKGFYHQVNLDRIRRIRGSKYKPFPPKNEWFEFDFDGYRPPRKETLFDAIRREIDAMMNSPISNGGVKGMRRTSKEILTWQNLFNDHDLRMNLFQLYIFIEIGGTDGGFFRYMYSRFLKEAADISGVSALTEIAERMYQSGEMFTRIGMLFKDIDTARNVPDLIGEASKIYDQLGDGEESIYTDLAKIVG